MLTDYCIMSSFWFLQETWLLPPIHSALWLGISVKTLTLSVPTPAQKKKEFDCLSFSIFPASLPNAFWPFIEFVSLRVSQLSLSLTRTHTLTRTLQLWIIVTVEICESGIPWFSSLLEGAVTSAALVSSVCMFSHTYTRAHTLHTFNERATVRKWQRFEDSNSCFQAWSTYWRSGWGSIRPLIFITEGERREIQGTTIPPSYHDPWTQDVFLLVFGC